MGPVPLTSPANSREQEVDFCSAVFLREKILKWEASTWQHNESPPQRMDLRLCPTDTGANQPAPENILNYSCQ